MHTRSAMGHMNTRRQRGQRGEDTMPNEGSLQRNIVDSPREGPQSSARSHDPQIRLAVPTSLTSQPVSMWRRSVSVLQGTAMAHVDGTCGQCSPSGHMHRMHDYSLK